MGYHSSQVQQQEAAKVYRESLCPYSLEDQRCTQQIACNLCYFYHEYQDFMDEIHGDLNV